MVAYAPIQNDSFAADRPLVLVTGASGLLGMELAGQLIDKGYRVRALYNSKAPTKIPEKQGLEWIQCNILDVIQLEESMHGVSYVYNCAGLVHFSPSRKKDLYKVNVEGIGNVVNAALAASVKKMVHVSSVAALGRLREDEAVTEKMQWTEDTSNSIYGHSKYLGELEVWRGVAEGLDAVVVNPSIILGAGDWKEGSTEIFKSVFDEFPWYAEGVTGFVDVRDVASLMIQLMESPVNAERFIVSAENAVYRDVFNQIADAFKKKRPHKKVTPFIASLVWRLEKIKSLFSGNDPLVTKETAITALSKVHFDNSKLLRFLPTFSYRPLSETISYTCRALQQKLNIH